MNLADLKKYKTPTIKRFKQQPPLLLIPEERWGETLYNSKGRYYSTPTGGIYPSVTTFLGFFEDESWLKDWKERVGEEEAKRISDYACLRGETVHAVLEAYVKNDPDVDPDKAGRWRFMFNQIKRALDKKLQAVIYSEHALYSDQLKIAGRVDLCGVWDGYTAIIDYKNKNRLCKREDVEGYFLQAATYAVMHLHQYFTLPEKLVIICAIEDENRREAQIFEEYTEPYVAKVLEHIARFHAESDYYPWIPDPETQKEQTT